MAELRRTNLFDENFYLANNPDVAASGVDPALHFAQRGWKEGRKPSPGFDPEFYLSRYPDIAESGANPLLHYLRSGRSEGRRPRSLLGGTDDDTFDPLPDAGVQTSQSILRRHSARWAPLPIFFNERAAPTLTILTDSVDPNSLFGGVATAIVVGTFIARRLNARLRLVTRDVAPDPAVLSNILRAHRVDWDGPSDFVHLPTEAQRPLSLGEKDVVLTTSWWGTRATLGSVSASRVVYLLQEDERMFYPFGDLRLRCSELLSEPSLSILVNTRQLFDHLSDGPDALPRFRERAHWFKPAFPSFPRPNGPKPSRNGKQNFFFYARPNNERNLYWRGLEVLNAAMREGILVADEWNIHFVGRKLPDIELPCGIKPSVWARLPWSEYANLVSQMDLGLCLMDTPHPSYPPLDLAASGAAAVTNTHGIKKTFEEWSRNIIAAPPSVSALCAALREGVELARDMEQRFANCAADHIPRDWEAQLQPVIDRLPAGI